MNNKRILVFSVASWNSKIGSNTWTTLLAGVSPDNVANICIREEKPDSPVCNNYFVISENRVLKSILKRKIKTGYISCTQANDEAREQDLSAHNERYKKMAQKRSYTKLLAREIVWKLGKWKTKELDSFLDSFKPDIILHSMEGYIHLNRIIEYAIKRTGARAIGYIWDDNFTYKQYSSLGYKLYRFFQRKSLKGLAKRTRAFFAISEKTKREADEFFGINSVVLTKPLSSQPTLCDNEIARPVRMLYTGNLGIGRDRTLGRLVSAIRTSNLNQEFLIDVYTKTVLSDEIREQIECDFCKIHAPIPQSEVLKKQREADALLFLEDVDGVDAKVARLSFSTKITDYLSAGKGILAIGNSDTAPIEYLKENNAALVATNDEEIALALKTINEAPSILTEYAMASASLGSKNHSKEKIEKIFFDTIRDVLGDKNEN